MLLSSRHYPRLSTLLLPSLRPLHHPPSLSRSISVEAVEKSEELLGKYIQERKKYETPSPFKNITPLHGRTPFAEEDVYNLSVKKNKPLPASKPRASAMSSESKKDISAKSNKYTRYTPGYTPANLQKSESTIVNDFMPESAKSQEEEPEENFDENADFENSENMQCDPSQVVAIPIGVLEESIEKVANVAIKLKKNEIEGPEAAEQLLDHLKLLLQLRASHEMPGEGEEGEDGEMGEMGEMGEEGEEREMGEMGEEEGAKREERGGREVRAAESVRETPALKQKQREQQEEEEYMQKAKKEEYASAEYWDNRYTKHPAALDWYQNYGNLRPTIRRKARPHHKILVVGCGNSLLSEEMYKDGLKNIENIDVSKVVLNMMEEKNKDLTDMTYKLCDVTNMTNYENESWDIIIDKGTYDALVHGGENDHIGHKMLKEIHRVLKKGGSFMLISHGNEEFRRPNFDLPEFSWKIDVQPLRYQETKDVNIYVYTMTKT